MATHFLPLSKNVSQKVTLVRDAGAQACLSDRAATFVACRPSGINPETFNSRLTGFFFFSWCESHGVFPRSAPLTDVADFFLIALFDKARSISTICAKHLCQIS